MGRHAVRRLTGKVESRWSRLTLPIAAVLVLSSLGGVFGEETGSGDPDPVCLRYLPDDCCVFGRIDLAGLMASPWGRGQDLTIAAGMISSLTPFNLKLDQIDTIFVGACKVTEDDFGQYVGVIHSHRPLVVSENHFQWTPKALGNQTLWVDNEEKTLAYCAVDEETLLMGPLDVISKVVQRDGPAEIPPALDQARQQLSPKAHVALAVLPTEALEVKDPGVAAYILAGTHAVNLELESADDVTMRAVVFCDDEAAVQKLRAIGALIHGLAQAQPDPTWEKLAQTMEMSVRDTVLTASATAPAEIFQVAETFSPAGGDLDEHLATPQWTESDSFSEPSERQPYPTSSQTWDPYAHPGMSVQPATYPPGISSSYAPQPAIPNPHAPTLKLDDVIRMSKAGVDEQVIQLYISDHQLPAALTADDLILLTESKVPTAVIVGLQGLPCAKPAEGRRMKPIESHAVPETSLPRVTFPAPHDGAAADSPLDGSSASVIPSDVKEGLLEGWERTWFTEEPPCTGPYRTHGMSLD